MDEIDALNEEWNRIRSQKQSTAGGCNSNSSETTNSSSKPRRKRSRWSNENEIVDQGPKPSNGSQTVAPSVQINFGDSVSKLVAERRSWEESQQVANVGGYQDCDRIASKKESVKKYQQPLNQELRRFPFGGGDEDNANTPDISSSALKPIRKYRHRNSSSSSESDQESQLNVRDSKESSPSAPGPWHSKSSEHQQDSESQKSPVITDQEAQGLASEGSSCRTFLERKTSVIVKDLTDWVTTSHILQDVKSSQIRNFSDVGIVRKRARGNPYRYAYVDFGTQTSATRWVQIRKGALVIGSQQFKLEQTYRDWQCPKCEVLNFGKSVLCFSCRDPKNHLLTIE